MLVLILLFSCEDPINCLIFHGRKGRFEQTLLSQKGYSPAVNSLLSRYFSEPFFSVFL